MTTTIPERSELEQKTAAAYNAALPTLLAREDCRQPLSMNADSFEMRRMLGDAPSVLDLGCGWGRAIPLLKSLGFGEIIGVDYAEDLLCAARGYYPDVDFRLGNIRSLKDVLGDRQFDSFLAIASLMHILPENMPDAVASIRSVLKTGAIGFLTTPEGDTEDIIDAQSLDTAGGKVPEGHIMLRNLWHPTTLANHFRTGGFRVISPSYNDGYMITMTVQAI